MKSTSFNVVLCILLTINIYIEVAMVNTLLDKYTGAKKYTENDSLPSAQGAYILKGKPLQANERNQS